MGCVTDCSPSLVALGDIGCFPETLPGGFYKFAFMKCDKDFDDVTGGVITDASRWADMIEATDIIVSNPLLASKPEDNVTRLRIESCSPEVVTGIEQTYAFEDYNADTSAFTHITWWKQIQTKYRALKFMAITCDGLVYGPFENGLWSINVSEIREQLKETPAKLAGSILVRPSSNNIVEPAYVPGLVGTVI